MSSATYEPGEEWDEPDWWAPSEIIHPAARPYVSGTMDTSAHPTERQSMTTAVDQQPATTDTAAPEMPVLTGHDRCDRCGAQAYVQVTLYSGSDLLFCAHHYAKHEAALAEPSLSVNDQRERLDTSAPEA